MTGFEVDKKFFVVCLFGLSIFSHHNRILAAPPSSSSPSQPNTSPSTVTQAAPTQGVPVKALPPQEQTRPKTPQAALNRLLEGNKRFMKDQSICPERNETRRLATVSKQKPFAIVVGCSDSRVPPELTFDQGIGDIFVVRIAGNVVSKLEMESVEYSAVVNGSSIIVVLGHQNCGAVTAVLENNTHDIESIAELIKPAVYKAKYKKENAELTLKDAIIINVQNSVERIKRNRVISRLINEGKLMIVGAYYDLASGEAQIITNEASNHDQNSKVDSRQKQNSSQQ